MEGCDVLIADLEELETMDASEIHSKRLNAKEVIFPKQGEFIFPIADGRIKTSGGDKELRTSTLARPINLAYACVKPKPRLCVCQGPFVKITNGACACVKNRAYACVKNRAHACVTKCVH